MANFSPKKGSRKRLKHTLVDSVFDADSKHIISFDTDRSFLIEIYGISVKKAVSAIPAGLKCETRQIYCR